MRNDYSRSLTIYKANGILFSFRDYDLQMSLPVKESSTIVASRILIPVWDEPGLTLLVIFACPRRLHLDGFSVPSLLSVFLLLPFWQSPMVPIILATILGVLISLIASRFRHTSAISVLLTLGSGF